MKSADTTKNQYVMQDPVKQYPHPQFPEQPQSPPGLAQDMSPKPDHGEESYKGFGRLAGRKALITGADSGIGRTTAIAFAREGADIAKQVASKGIRVNAVAPGPVWTPLQTSGGQPSDKIPEFGAEVPLGRPAQPAELAPIYVVLASQESSYVTGEVYGVTGGNPLP